MLGLLKGRPRAAAYVAAPASLARTTSGQTSSCYVHGAASTSAAGTCAQAARNKQHKPMLTQHMSCAVSAPPCCSRPPARGVTQRA